MALITGGSMQYIWNVVLAGIPYGLGVASINVGKHIDKRDDDKARGVGTFPVRVGEAIARRVDQIAIDPHLRHYCLSGLRAALFHARHADRLPGFQACLTRSSSCSIIPSPTQPPAGYTYWPTWFSAGAFNHNRQFGGWLILGLIIDTLLHVIPYTADLIQRYWPPM